MWVEIRRSNVVYVVANLRIIIRNKEDSDEQWSLISIDRDEDDKAVEKMLIAYGDFQNGFCFNELELGADAFVLIRHFVNLGNATSDVIYAFVIAIIDKRDDRRCVWMVKSVCSICRIGLTNQRRFACISTRL